MRWPRASILASLRVPGVRAALIAATVVGALTILVNVFAVPSNNVTVEFGNPNAPTPEQNCTRGGPEGPQEACANAFHKLIPGAVTIQRGQTVDFQRFGFHQVAIYLPGTSPNDIQVMRQDINRVNDPQGGRRILLSDAGAGGPPVPFPTTSL